MTRNNNKYTKEILKEVVSNCKNIREVMKAFGLSPTGGNCTYMAKRIKKYGISTDHFAKPDFNKGKILGPKKKPEDVLINNEILEARQKGHVLTRNLLLIDRTYECEECKCSDIWNNKQITLHVDHIDGNWKNNLPENLRFLCPNCHSQTDTFSKRKKQHKQSI